MKLLVFLAFVLLASSGWAQAPAKPEAPKAAPEAPKPMAPMADAPKQASGPKIPNPRRWTEDARHCLERPTPTEIIKCAEEFL